MRNPEQQASGGWSDVQSKVPNSPSVIPYYTLHKSEQETTHSLQPGGWSDVQNIVPKAQRRVAGLVSRTMILSPSTRLMKQNKPQIASQ